MYKRKYNQKFVVPFDSEYKEGMYVSCTNWHYDGNGQAVKQLEDGTFQKRESKGRVAEILVNLDKATSEDPNKNKHFIVHIVREILVSYPDSPVKELRSVSAFTGDPDNPIGYDETEMLKHYPLAWAEFKERRGYVALGGQWVKTPLCTFLEELQKKPEEEEKKNGMQQLKSKSSGSN
jgi:hypothetical protein